MALPPCSPYLPKAQAACPQWRNPKEACQGAASQVCRLPIWHDDKSSLVRQGNQGRPLGLRCNQTWRKHLSWPNDIYTSGIFFAQLKGNLTKKCYKCATVFVNRFSCLQLVHPTWQQVWQSTRCQACLRTVCCRTWSQDPSLSLQQRTLPRHHLLTSMPSFDTTSDDYSILDLSRPNISTGEINCFYRYITL